MYKFCSICSIPSKLTKQPDLRLDRQLSELSMGDLEPRDHSPLPTLHIYPGFPCKRLSLLTPPALSSEPHVSPRLTPCPFCSLLKISRPPENVFLACLSLSAKFSALSAGPKIALHSKVNVSGSSSPFSTSNKRLELAPQSPHTARLLGFQVGWASVRNEEWAWPKFGDVSWKLKCC